MRYCILYLTGPTDERPNERGGRTAQKHNAFADNVRWQSHDKYCIRNNDMHTWWRLSEPSWASLVWRHHAICRRCPGSLVVWSSACDYRYCTCYSRCRNDSARCSESAEPADACVPRSTTDNQRGQYSADEVSHTQFFWRCSGLGCVPQARTSVDNWTRSFTGRLPFPNNSVKTLKGIQNTDANHHLDFILSWYTVHGLVPESHRTLWRQ